MMKKGIFLALILIGITALLASVMGARFSQVNAHSAEPSLEGAWIMDISISRQAPVKGLITFTRDGSVIETDTVLRAGSPWAQSSGHGRWVGLEDRQFAVAWVTLLYGEDGRFAGTFKLQGTLRRDETADQFAGTFRFDIFDPNGAVVASDGGRMVGGTRIAIEERE